MTFHDIALDILTGLATAVGGIITAASPFIVKAVTSWLAARTSNERVKGALDRVGDAAAKAVRDVSATMNEQLKKALEDGVITPDEREQLRQTAIDKTKAYVGAVGMNDVAKTLGWNSAEEMQAALATEIENAVHRMKIERAAAEAATPVVAVKT